MKGSKISVPQVIDVAYDGLTSVVAYAMVEPPMWAHPGRHLLDDINDHVFFFCIKNGSIEVGWKPMCM